MAGCAARPRPWTRTRSCGVGRGVRPARRDRPGRRGRAATLYRAILQFEKDGPAVTGEREGNDAVARSTYKAWIGLYTHGPAVVVQFVADEDDGVRRILRKWEIHRETVTEPGDPL
ncbi:hypothetical protein ACFV03_25720 [Streptomyces mirabilis]|uniref:hypothetical protein n=1 Tax=Streptomyces mirabilis TaxID=68239 RepID=UPI0036900D79